MTWKICTGHFAPGGLRTPRSFARKPPILAVEATFECEANSAHSPIPSAPCRSFDDRLLNEPVEEPEARLKSCISALSSVKTTRATELNWEEQFSAILDARRLVNLSSHLVERNLHVFVQALMPSIDSLRSNVAKHAIICCGELFASLGPRIEPQLDCIITPLIKKVGEGSGFINAEADHVLGQMHGRIGEARIIASLTSALSFQQRGTLGRCAIAKHLEIATRSVVDKSLQIGSREGERLLEAALSLLSEGSQDVRSYAKRIVYFISLGIVGNAGWGSRKGGGESVCRSLRPSPFTILDRPISRLFLCPVLRPRGL